MRLLFSRREKARKAAIEADARHMVLVHEAIEKNQPYPEYWGYVINAALEAAVGDLPEIPGGPFDGLANEEDS